MIMAVVVVVALAALLCLLCTLVHKYVWEPLRLRGIMAKQGVPGPPFHVLFGNLQETHAATKTPPVPLDDTDYISPVAPQYSLFFPRFGKCFLYCYGPEARFVVRDPEIAREILVLKFPVFEKSATESYFTSQVFGTGLYSLEGHLKERTAFNRFFHQESLKAIVEGMVQGAVTSIQRWERVVEEGAGALEVNVEPDIHMIAGKILALTAFSGESAKMMEIFELQSQFLEDLFDAMASLSYWIPGFRFLRMTKQSRELAELRSKIDTLLLGVVRDRLKLVQNMGLPGRSYGTDLFMHMMIAAGSDTGGPDKAAQYLNQLASNCKFFFFAGQHTIASVMSYTLLMLARHPEWQDRARKEVLETISSEEVYDISVLSRLKTVGMILNEVMRIFVVVPAITRVAREDTQLGEFFIPKGLAVEIAVGAMHKDARLWGEDVGKFNPDRFANGVANACSHPLAFLPFSMGPRTCIGNNFAVMEAKLVVAMVLRRFQLLPSPNYRHHGRFAYVQRPRFGIPIILKALNTA